MSQDERETWLLTAYMEVQHIPAKPFLSATANARTVCDHPAKIIPAIIKHSKEWSDNLLKVEKTRRKQFENATAPRLTRQETTMPDDERAEVSNILKEVTSNLSVAAKAERQA